jgi:hypothetical protein
VQRIADVVEQWERPQHDWGPKTAWRLFNSATFALEGKVAERPDLTKKLHQVIDGVCAPSARYEALFFGSEATRRLPICGAARVSDVCREGGRDLRRCTVHRGHTTIGPIVRSLMRSRPISTDASAPTLTKSRFGNVSLAGDSLWRTESSIQK